MSIKTYCNKMLSAEKSPNPPHFLVALYSGLGGLVAIGVLTFITRHANIPLFMAILSLHLLVLRALNCWEIIGTRWRSA